MFDAVGVPVPSDTYADGSNDDNVPDPRRVRAEARLSPGHDARVHEFLRDTDATPRLSNLPPVPEIYDPMVTDTSGKLAYKLWKRSARASRRDGRRRHAFRLPADFDQNGTIEVADLFGFLDRGSRAFGMSGGTFPADADGDGSVSVSDLFQYLDAWFAGFWRAVPVSTRAQPSQPQTPAHAGRLTADPQEQRDLPACAVLPPRWAESLARMLGHFLQPFDQQSPARLIAAT